MINGNARLQGWRQPLITPSCLARRSGRPSCASASASRPAARTGNTTTPSARTNGGHGPSPRSWGCRSPAWHTGSPRAGCRRASKSSRTAGSSGRTPRSWGDCARCERSRWTARSASAGLPVPPKTVPAVGHRPCCRPASNNRGGLRCITIAHRNRIQLVVRMGRRAYAGLAWPEPPAEQRLRAALRDRRGAHIPGDESADAAAFDPPLTLFRQLPVA